MKKKTADIAGLISNRAQREGEECLFEVTISVQEDALIFENDVSPASARVNASSRISQADAQVSIVLA
jgi:hypothetical protein